MHAATQTTMDVPILEARGIVKRYGGVVALAGIDLAVATRGVTALIGANGAGKSTFFQVCNGLIAPTSGSLSFRGVGIDRLAPHRRAELGLACTFQTPRTFPRLTVLENVLAGQHARAYAGFWHATLRTARYRRAERMAQEAAHEALAFVSDDLYRRRNDPARTLPYGLLKLLEMARAISGHPAAILLDEPAAGLNAGEKAHLAQLIGRISEADTSVVVVEHDMRLVKSVSSRVVVLDRGRVLAEGGVADVLRDERVVRAYLGEAVT